MVLPGSTPETEPDTLTSGRPDAGPTHTEANLPRSDTTSLRSEARIKTRSPAATTGGRSFRLTPYFAVTSLVCILVIATALGWIYQHLALRELAVQAERHNAALGQALSNALWSRFDGLVKDSPQLDREEILRRLQRDQLREAVIGLMTGSKVIKVKLYNPDGRTVFSTDLTQVGIEAAGNPGFEAAVVGRVKSDLTHRNTFDSFEGNLQDLDVLATYRPAFAPDRSIRGVFEIYTDVTDLVAQTRETRALIITAVLSLLALLYLLLHLLVSRAQRMLDMQTAEINRTLAEVAQANRELDQRVNQRTTELTQTNEALRDEITERATVENKLRLASQVFDNSVEGITITDAEQRILAVNRAFTVVTGYEESEVIGKTPRLLQSGRQSPAFYDAMWHALKTVGHWQGEIWNRRKNGEVFPEWLSLSAVKDSFGNISNFVGVFSDITKLKDSQERLDYLAHHDVVTGLPNRLLFNQRVVMAIDEAARSRRRFALVFLDLDHFKNVNDSLGHDTGDTVLRTIADRLRRGVRASDTLARLGGDEFIALIENISSAKDAQIVSQQLLESMHEPITEHGHEMFISASIGISVFPDDGADVHTLVKHADAAMYKAKSLGRNAYHFYSPEMTTDAAERLQTEAQLRRSLENSEMELYYQPLIKIATGELLGAEALVRWHHPEKGLVPPLKFIPITEETGFINDLGIWVIEEACRQICRWDAAGVVVPRVAVNVSVRQLERPGFIDKLAAILKSRGVSASRLDIEITESVLMQTENAAKLLHELRALGVSLSIDDFGTGYSSLSYLRRLPIDKLKIDQSFINDLSTNANDAAIVKSVIALARTMSLSTVAEGVEHEDQLEFLRREGCHTAQGYYFSPALTADEFSDWLLARPQPKAIGNVTRPPMASAQKA